MGQSHSVRCPACMVLEDSGRVRWWGQGAVNLFNISAADAAGKTWWELLPQALQAEARQAWPSLLSASGGRATLARPGEAATAPWEIIVEPIPNAGSSPSLWHGVVVAPATRQNQAADLLREGVFETLQDALVILQNGHIAALNLAAEDFFGVTREAAVGRPLSVLGIVNDPAEAQAEIAPGRPGALWWASVHRASADQETTLVETRLFRLPYGDEPALLLYFRHPSQQLTLRKGLLRAQQTQSLGPVINGIIHDFNNYFTAILSNLDLAETSASLPPECLNFVRNARLASQNGAEVIRQLQLFSRTGASHPELLDPRVLVEEIIQLMRHCLGRAVRVGKLEVLSPPGLVLGRPALLRQMLINVCLNAREAMPCGGELSFSLDRVEFSAAQAPPPRRAGLFAHLTVADTGHGMAPETVARLQQPFFTTHAERELGLGLFAAREILANHGGWMEIESQKAKGTRVHLYLPVRPITPRTEPVAQDALLLQQKKLEGSERVLVVEADPATRTLMKAVLGYRGYEVTVVEKGEAALQPAAPMPPPHVLIADVHLPDMTGWQLLHRLRHLWPELKVILLVQEMTPDLLPLAQRVKAKLLPKPVETQRLLTLLRECLEEP